MSAADELRFRPLIIRAALQEHVDPALLAALVGHESNFGEDAIRDEPGPNDSIGLTQITINTAKSVGYTGIVPGDKDKDTGLYNPWTNLVLGAKYLRRQIDTAGGIENGLSAYNGGYNPSIGFGAKTSRDVTGICLARNTAGDCIKRVNVPKGAYANQAYVDDVLRRFKAFMPLYATPVGPAAPTGTVDAAAVSKAASAAAIASIGPAPTVAGLLLGFPAWAIGLVLAAFAAGLYFFL